MVFKALRKSANLTQQDVGEILGVKRNTIAMWECGKSFPRSELLPKIATLYNCSIETLLGELCKETTQTENTA